MKLHGNKYVEVPKWVRVSNNRQMAGNSECVVVSATLLATCLKIFLFFTFQVAVSLASYSGQNQPPMFGDYEAQRHWMEITTNLPVGEWYKNSSENNLMYWGLDYPPLTAYHHHLLGIISRKIKPEWVTLNTSRGYESPDHKLFMRISAIAVFYIFYLPAVFLTTRKNTGALQHVAIMYPSLLIIDNGHFQYNSISLGLFISCYVSLINYQMVLGSVFFVCALNYKQMELYHSLPVFVFILSRSIVHPIVPNIHRSFGKLLKIALTVIATFMLIWWPFFYSNAVKDVLIRVFPFNRGLYEDKVASFWCAFSFILKRLPIQKWQIAISTGMVLASSFPSLMVLFRKPSNILFRLSLVTTSLSFFLFSFHVHEKTILLVAGSSILLFQDFPTDALYLLNMTNISIFSLCIKDQFALALVPFIAYSVVTLWYCKQHTNRPIAPMMFSIVVGILLCILELCGPENQRFPHIYQFLNAFFTCLHFIYFWALFSKKCWDLASVRKSI